ncbi:hypothetical protein E2320_015235 [Naja naja]|nr:hypothetical protein E2320_015235 [Naja naja]
MHVWTEVPENTLIGRTILSLSCYDPDNINSSLTYNIVDQSPPYSFKMDGPNLQVNSSLDYDSESMATLNFQYKAAILVIDEGSPAQTTTVPVLVTVRQVNEFYPKCSKRVFNVPENTEYGYRIGNVNGSDQDYPFNNIEYSIMDEDAFYINSRTGQLHVLLPLDYEERKVYHLAVILKDLENEAAPGTQKTTTCNVTIFVQITTKKPIVLHRTVTYWAPDPWFVVVLTLTGILLFSALGLLFWQFCRRNTNLMAGLKTPQHWSTALGVSMEENEEPTFWTPATLCLVSDVSADMMAQE